MSTSPLAFRPPNWSTRKSLYVINVAAGDSADGQSHQYVFDAMIVGNHRQEAVGTEHPLQTGFNVVDHIYLKQAELTLNIEMSDALDSYTAGMWTGANSKSVSAFQTMRNLILNRTVLTINTRLYTYTPCYLRMIDAPDDADSYHGLKATLYFKQLSTVTLASQSLSARPNATDSTSTGTQQGTQPDQNTVNQHQVPNTGGLSDETGPTSPDGIQVHTGTSVTQGQQNYINQGSTVPGGGTYDSNNVSSLPSTP